MPDAAQRLAENPVFAGLGAAAVAQLLRAAELRVYQPREPVLGEDDPPAFVYAVLSGSVRVYHSSPGGLQVTLKIFKPPSVFGEMEALCNLPMLENVAALEESQLLRIPRPVFLDLLRAHPALTVALLKDVCARFCIACQHEKSLAFHSLRTRLAHFLVTYAGFDGERTARGVRLRLKMTQDDMADALGVTRRAIAREVIRWQKEGVLAQERGHYILRKIDVLTSEAEPVQLGLTYTIGRALRSG
jgi:CRP-like cAMP-binding protein